MAHFPPPTRDVTVMALLFVIALLMGILAGALL
jgi:hypothetical protein